MTTDSGKHLHLLVPGLLDPRTRGVPGEAPPSLPALETFLARADVSRPVPTNTLEAVVFALFQIEAGEDDLPVAAVTRVYDLGVIDSGWWLRADPAHLVPERDRLILAAGGVLDLTQDEANQLVAEIMEVYKADGWVLKAPRPHRWYLKPPRAPKITTTQLPLVIGQDVHPYLPQGKDGLVWHGILNELQILLHTANVNIEREIRGKLPVNSLWFWGGGRLPRIKPVSYAQLWSEETVSLALARLAEVPIFGVPAGFGEWQRQTIRPGEHLVVLDQGREPMLYRDTTAWADFLARFERDWMVPLLLALRHKSLAGATLHTEDGRRFLLTPPAARRWWRRRRPLAAWLE